MFKLLIIILSIISICIASNITNNITNNSTCKIPKAILNDGNAIPVLGFGTYTINDPNIISEAINNGYRLIDTAWAYGNEVAIGQAISKEIANKTVRREDLYIITKVWPNFLSRSGAVENLKIELKNLQLNYSDLALIHYPFAVKNGSDPEPKYSNGSLIPLDSRKDFHYVEAYKGLEDAKRLNLTRSIGLANFNLHQVKVILNASEIKPAVLQVENNPLYQQNELVGFAQSNGIRVIGYSPLRKNTPEIASEPILLDIAHKHNRTVLQVALRWNIKRNVTVIPRSNYTVHQRQNLDALNFDLTQDDMEKISKIEKRPKIINVVGSEALPDYSFVNETFDLHLN